MAASTIVFTYDVGVDSGTGEKEAKVTSFTVDGSAYAALTSAEIIEALAMMKQGLALITSCSGKMPATGWSGRDVTS